MFKRSQLSVVACVPYYRGRRYIRRAVESLLAQTWPGLLIIVVNDGDSEPPWTELASISDPRLMRFDLMRNHGGPFFAYEVVLQAVSCEWLLIQEQDDWSDPDRLRQLLMLAGGANADAAVSAQYFHQQRASGDVTTLGVRWRNVGRVACPTCGIGKCQRCFVDFGLTPLFRHRAPHNALFKVSTLKKIGGYYAGFRLHYDSLLMNHILMLGRLVHTRTPLYHRLFRADSLTQAETTGFQSAVSRLERTRLSDVYRQTFAQYQLYLRGQSKSQELATSIRQLARQWVSAKEMHELMCETSRLRSLLCRRA